MSTALSRTSAGDTSKKPQRIHTPRCILDPLAEFWPKGIALDPCGSPDGLVRADRIVCDDDGGDGLAVIWPERTFINPPYRTLKAWLAHGLTQESEQVWLIPVRTHRKWWRAFEADCDGLVWLNPLSFDGYDQKFPAPLCLTYRGLWHHKFDRTFGHLGGVRQ